MGGREGGRGRGRGKEEKKRSLKEINNKRTTSMSS